MIASARRSAWVLLTLVLPWAACCPAAEEMREAPWEELARYPCLGLSPLYRPTARRLEQVLAEPRRWEVLPRPVTGVLAREDQPPCFEMRSGDTYYNGLPQTAPAVRWAAEQTWAGGFRLLYNATALAAHEGELWKTVQGRSNLLRFYSGGDWSLYRPFVSRQGSASIGRNRLARDDGGGWWVASNEGVFRVGDGYWERVSIPDWPGGPAVGIVDDARGRLAAWSGRTEEGTAAVAFYADGKWTSVNTACERNWTQGGIRPDGSVVLMNNAQVTILNPSGATPFEDEPPENAADASEVAHYRNGHFHLEEKGWVVPSGARVVARDGGVLFAAKRLSGDGSGLVRIPSNSPPQWIEFTPSRELRLAAFPDGGFVLLEPTQGAFLLSKDSRNPEQVAEAGDVLSGDELLGCDRGGHVYIGRGSAVLMLSPRAEPVAALEVRPLAEFAANSRFPVPMNAAIDSKGRCWFIRGEDGGVMVLAPGGDTPVLRDDRLTGAKSLWPGRDGAMLVFLADGRAALAYSERSLETAESVVALARTHVDKMLAAAPKASRAPRRDLSGAGYYQRQPPIASPWLAAGGFLWLSDGEGVYRFGPRDGQCAEAESIEAAKIVEGDFAVLGPMPSGRLLLAKRDGDHYSRRVTAWFWIDEPGGDCEPNPVTSPPSKRGGASLESPASFVGDGLLDAQGRLWLHQGFDRVYRIDSRETWPMLKDFGRPRFEHPSGCVWAHHTARVFPGYETAVADSHRSCVPTYMEHLTPLFGDGNMVTCLTPTGLAGLHFDPHKPEENAITHRTHVHWGERPCWYVGHNDQSVFLILGSNSPFALVTLKLPEPPRSDR